MKNIFCLIKSPLVLRVFAQVSWEVNPNSGTQGSFGPYISKDQGLVAWGHRRKNYNQQLWQEQTCFPKVRNCQVGLGIK